LICVFTGDASYEKACAMNSVLIAVITFVLVFGGALAGLAIRIPAHHQDTESRDVVKLVLGLVATIAALVLSLLIASAHSPYATQQSEVQQLGAQIIQLDETFVHYGPETSESRTELRRIVEAELTRMWPNVGVTSASIPAPPNYKPQENLYDKVASLTPKSDSQRSAQSRALQLMTTMGTTSRVLNEQAGGSLPWPFLVVLVFWLVALFVGFGLYARRNTTLIAVLFVGALTAAAAIFLILEMNRPYTGLMQISSAPMRNALSQIGH
jgi:hypothetical protein